MILSYQERIDRILNTNHIVLIDDWSIHRVESVYPLGNIIFIDTGGVKYQDTEVMTLKEAGKGSMFYYDVLQLLNINY
jgi:hypothetical protein